MTLRPEVKCNFRPFYFALHQNHFILFILTHAIQDLLLSHYEQKAL